jgi:hypothetical protein
MTDYTLTYEQKKALTEMMGECYWNLDDLDDEGICKKCGTCVEGHHPNRTFTTDADMVDLFRWLVRRGKWNEFEEYAYDRFSNEIDNSGFDTATWLFYDPSRFCWLVNEAREKGVI